MERNYSSKTTLACENLRLVEEMSRVHELISQLHAIVLPLTHTDRSSKLVRDLFEDVFGSCTIVLSKLQNCSLPQETESDNWGNMKSRKMNSWTVTTTVPHNDGHEWTKYGQKKINCSKFQRSYYRCAHHKDHGCSATKRVQQKDGDDYPPKFEVTYNMKHICKSEERSKETSCIEKKLENSISTPLSDHLSDNFPANTDFTELDVEELLYEPHINTNPTEDVPNIFSPSWEFNLDIWDNISDELFS